MLSENEDAMFVIPAFHFQRDIELFLSAMSGELDLHL